MYLQKEQFRLFHATPRNVKLNNSAKLLQWSIWGVKTNFVAEFWSLQRILLNLVACYRIKLWVAIKMKSKNFAYIKGYWAFNALFTVGKALPFSLFRNAALSFQILATVLRWISCTLRTVLKLALFYSTLCSIIIFSTKICFLRLALDFWLASSDYGYLEFFGCY